jgi:nucleosome assembly protein 1-like 1
MDIDYDICNILIEEVLPYSLEYYLGVKKEEHDEEGELSQLDEEEEDDDESEEEVKPKNKKKNKAKKSSCTDEE